MFSGMVLLKRVVTAIVQTIDPRGRAGFEQFEILRTRRSPIRVGLGKKGVRFRNNSNENADD
jgi:hypothetical protein